MDNKSHVSRDDREGEKKITNDDKKLNFEGLGYEVDNDTYKVIKVMMDGEE